MNLEDLGFDDWFRERAEGALQAGRDLARVTAVDRDRYLVAGERGEIRAEPAGRLLYAADSAAALPCVGDWVSVQYHSDGAAAIIHDVLPRKTLLRRKRAGKDVDYQLIAANIDTALVVQSCQFDFNVRRLERYLVVVREARIEPAILLSKTDLAEPDAVARMAAEIARSSGGAPVLPFSNATGEGMDLLLQLVRPGRTYCLVGSSGVGKTTLLNRLLGGGSFETDAVSATGEGRHVTARRQLIILPGGAMLVDTPGMRELGLLGAGDAVGDAFADIADLAAGCRFADCGHDGEPGCAVLDAVGSGGLDRKRYESYMKLAKESAFHDMSYVERRKKDKAFGRFIKKALKPGPR
jgi:ribosome biogenesis GTPase